MSNFVIDSYRFAAVETCQNVTNGDGVIGVGGGGGAITEVGFRILTGSPFIGMQPTEIKVKLRKGGDTASPTGTGTMKVYNDSDSLVTNGTSSNTIAASSLSTSYSEQTFEFSGLSALAADYTIAIQGWSTADQDRIDMYICSPSEYSTQYARFNQSGWVNRTARDAGVCMK